MVLALALGLEAAAERMVVSEETQRSLVEQKAKRRRWKRGVALRPLACPL